MQKTVSSNSQHIINHTSNHTAHHAMFQPLSFSHPPLELPQSLELSALVYRDSKLWKGMVDGHRENRMLYVVGSFPGGGLTMNDLDVHIPPMTHTKAQSVVFGDYLDHEDAMTPGYGSRIIEGFREATNGSLLTTKYVSDYVYASPISGADQGIVFTAGSCSLAHVCGIANVLLTPAQRKYAAPLLAALNLISDRIISMQHGYEWLVYREDRFCKPAIDGIGPGEYQKVAKLAQVWDVNDFLIESLDLTYELAVPLERMGLEWKFDDPSKSKTESFIRQSITTYLLPIIDQCYTHGRELYHALTTLNRDSNHASTVELSQPLPGDTLASGMKAGFRGTGNVGYFRGIQQDGSLLLSVSPHPNANRFRARVEDYCWPADYNLWSQEQILSYESRLLAAWVSFLYEYCLKAGEEYREILSK